MKKVPLEPVSNLHRELIRLRIITRNAGTACGSIFLIERNDSPASRIDDIKISQRQGFEAITGLEARSLRLKGGRSIAAVFSAPEPSPDKRVVSRRKRHQLSLESKFVSLALEHSISHGHALLPRISAKSLPSIQLSQLSSSLCW